MSIRFHGCQYLLIRSLAVTLIIVFSENGATYAQDTLNEIHSARLWGRLGVGTLGGGDFAGIGGTIEVQYSSPLGLVGIRYLTIGNGTSEPLSFRAIHLTEISSKLRWRSNHSVRSDSV